MSSLIVIISACFLASGLAFGIATKVIKSTEDALGMIIRSWAILASLLFLFLLIAQFIAYFDFSNIAQVLAIALGDILEHLDVGKVVLLLGIIVVTMVVDIIMPAKIAKWAILAPIFVPLMLRLGVVPQTVLAAYRVGDSPINVITPLMPYFPLMVVFAARYQRERGHRDRDRVDDALRLGRRGVLGAVLRGVVPARDPAGSRLAGVSDATITFVVLGGAVVLFVWNRLPVPVVALGVALALYGAGVIDVDEAFAGFGDPTVVFIASLFVVSEALDATGVTTWAGQRLVAAAGERRREVGGVAPAAGGRAVGGADAQRRGRGAAAADRAGRGPDRARAVAAADPDGLQRLRGRVVGVDGLAGQRARRRGGRPDDRATRSASSRSRWSACRWWRASSALVVWLGPRLLPERRPRALPPDLSEHARTLVEDYTLVRHAVPDALFTRASGVAEVVVPPRSALVGLDLVPGMATPSGDLVVLAVRRAGADLGPRDGPLREGDLLLLEGPWGALEHHLGGDEVLVVDARTRSAARSSRSARARAARWSSSAAWSSRSAAGLMPAAVAGVLAAGALVLLQVVGVDQAFRAIEWTAVVLIAGLIPLSHALQTHRRGRRPRRPRARRRRQRRPARPAGRPRRSPRSRSASPSATPRPR